MKLEVRNVSCGYSKDRPLQENITFTTGTGEVCCILGPNGCGKTTLFKTILGLTPALAGAVYIDGEDVSTWKPGRFAEAMAFVSQISGAPFPYRVKDIVLLGRVSKVGNTGVPGDEDYRVVERVLNDLGIYGLRDKSYTAISGGELQLVMIARALAQEPRILVLDEPTAALDYGNVVRVITKIRELSEQGYGILMTTHSPDHAFMCKSNVLLLQKEMPMRYGRAVDVITERNMQQAYGVNVKIVEFVDTHEEITRMCAPVF